MARRLLHLLLAFTLALNGISAPWAMARMSHDAHAGHDTGTVPGTTAATGAQAHHAAHGDHGEAGLAATPTRPVPDLADDTCCDGTSCPCGCVLPPVVPVFASSLPSHRPMIVPFVFPSQHAVVRHGNPPFRPPAA